MRCSFPDWKTTNDRFSESKCEGTTIWAGSGTRSGIFCPGTGRPKLGRNLFYPPHPHPNPDHPIDSINPDNHLLGKISAYDSTWDIIARDENQTRDSASERSMIDGWLRILQQRNSDRHSSSDGDGRKCLSLSLRGMGGSRLAWVRIRLNLRWRELQFLCCEVLDLNCFTV